MRYFPISVDTKDKKILVAGGGRAAFLKLKSLIFTMASIDVVSASFSDEVLKLSNNYPNKLFLKTMTINPNSIDFEDDYIIVFACTDNKEVNKKLRLYFKHKKVQVLTSDDRENSDFITSSLLHRGNITIAVNTEGRSPTASKMIIKEAEKILTEELIKKVDLLSSIRQLLLKDKDKSTNEILTISEMEKLSLLSCSDLEEKLKELNKSGE